MSDTKGATHQILKGIKSAGNKMPKGAWGKTMVGMTGFDVYQNVQMGDDVGTALVKAGAQHIYWTMAPALAMTTTFAPMVGELGYSAGKFIHEKEQWWNKQFYQTGMVGGNYMDNQRALTMRQAGVQAIQGSKLNARSALGGEAQIFSPWGRGY